MWLPPTEYCYYYWSAHEENPQGLVVRAGPGVPGSGARSRTEVESLNPGRPRPPDQPGGGRRHKTRGPHSLNYCNTGPSGGIRTGRGHQDRSPVPRDPATADATKTGTRVPETVPGYPAQLISICTYYYDDGSGTDPRVSHPGGFRWKAPRFRDGRACTPSSPTPLRQTERCY